MKFRAQVIEYWNSSKLSSTVSSSSKSDEMLAIFDNKVENIRLNRLLKKFECAGNSILDVGAGYGRFVPTMRQHFKSITLLEPAAEIFEQMCDLWKGSNNIQFCQRDFESFLTRNKYSVVFASGVVYFYDDDDLSCFANRASGMLKDEGFIIFRDFISCPRKNVVKSSYVMDAHCYYRTQEDWGEFARKWGFDLLAVVTSKPSFKYIRNPIFLNILEFFKLKGIFGLDRLAMLFSGDKWCVMREPGINSCFIVLKKC